MTVGCPCFCDKRGIKSVKYPCFRAKGGIFTAVSPCFCDERGGKNAPGSPCFCDIRGVFSKTWNEHGVKKILRVPPPGPVFSQLP